MLTSQFFDLVVLLCMLCALKNGLLIRSFIFLNSFAIMSIFKAFVIMKKTFFWALLIIFLHLYNFYNILIWSGWRTLCLNISLYIFSLATTPKTAKKSNHDKKVFIRVHSDQHDWYDTPHHQKNCEIERHKCSQSSILVCKTFNKKEINPDSSKMAWACVHI